MRTGRKVSLGAWDMTDIVIPMADLPPKGRGSRMGYKPYLYMEDDDWMDEYLNNPEFERNMYRMGYHPDHSDMRMDVERTVSKSDTVKPTTDTARIAGITMIPKMQIQNRRWTVR